MSVAKRNKASFWLSIVAVAVSVLTVLGLAIGIGNSKITSAKVNSLNYKNGAITETGKVIESNESAVLKEMKTTNGMIIEIDEETATITYKVAFYDKDGNFISMTEEQSSDFDVINVPENATQFNVMITPNEIDGEVVKLDAFNRAKYVKQLKVGYSRE